MISRVCILLFTLTSFSALADKPKLTVGLFKAKPFAYDEKNQVLGIVPKFIEKMLGEHFNLNLIILPYLRAIKAIDAGSVDMVLMYPNPNVELHALSSCLTFGNDNLIVSKHGVSNFNIKPLALIKGSNYGISLKAYKNQIGVVDYEQSIKLFEASRVSSILISSAAWKYYKPNLKTKNYTVRKINFVQNMFYFKKKTDQKIISQVCNLNEEFLKKYPSKKFDALLNEL